MKTICFDYDGTITDFHEYLLPMAEKMKDAGFNIIICTMRYEHERDDLLKKLCKKYEVYFTAREAKETYLINKGIIPNLWIDDNPRWIFTDSK